MKTLSKIITLASGITMLFASSVCYAGGPGAFASPGRSLGVGRIQHGPGGGGSGGGGNGGIGGSSGREESPGGQYASPAGPPNNSPVDHPTKAEFPVDEITTSLAPADEPVSTVSGDKEEVCDTASCLAPNRSDASVTDTLTRFVAAHSQDGNGDSPADGESPVGVSASFEDPVIVDKGWRTKGKPPLTIFEVLQGAIDVVGGEIDDLKATETAETWTGSDFMDAITALTELQSLIVNLREATESYASYTSGNIAVKTSIERVLNKNNATFLNSLWAPNSPGGMQEPRHKKAGIAVFDATQNVQEWIRFRESGT